MEIASVKRERTTLDKIIILRLAKAETSVESSFPVSLLACQR